MKKDETYNYQFVLDRTYDYGGATDNEWEKLTEILDELLGDEWNTNRELEMFIQDWIYENRDRWIDEERKTSI